MSDSDSKTEEVFDFHVKTNNTGYPHWLVMYDAEPIIGSMIGKLNYEYDFEKERFCFKTTQEKAERLDSALVKKLPPRMVDGKLCPGVMVYDANDKPIRPVAPQGQAVHGSKKDEPSI
jgi:hypothetical protein